jgi:hypothetical protein
MGQLLLYPAYDVVTLVFLLVVVPIGAVACCAAFLVWVYYAAKEPKSGAEGKTSNSGSNTEKSN